MTCTTKESRTSFLDKSNTTTEMKDRKDPQTTPSTKEENNEPAPLYPPNRVVTREYLDVLNILVHPVWVFDIQKCCMKWANNCAVELWNATSLQDLLDRDFKTGMSEATITRLATYLVQFEQGQQMTDQWTFYPKVKGLSGAPAAGTKSGTMS